MERLSRLENHLSKETSGKFPFHSNLKGKVLELNKVLVISGASRGIGKAIAIRCARDGAKIAIFAKTADPHPKLEGTIFSAAEEIKKVGGECLPFKVDIRSEEQVKNAIEEVVKNWGTIDILINNASAIDLLDTQTLTMKQFDLIHQINLRGTFLMTKYCAPHMKSNSHILTLSPPITLKHEYFENHVGYTVSKFGMSLLAFV